MGLASDVGAFEVHYRLRLIAAEAMVAVVPGAGQVRPPAVPGPMVATAPGVRLIVVAPQSLRASQTGESSVFRAPPAGWSRITHNTQFRTIPAVASLDRSGAQIGGSARSSFTLIWLALAGARRAGDRFRFRPWLRLGAGGLRLSIA